MKKAFVLSLAVLGLASCAHHQDVRPGANGVHRVLIHTDDSEVGSQEAIRQANNYCEEKKKSAAFLDENKKYVGDMDEKTYNQGKRISKVAQGIGGAAWVFGGKNESKAGGLVGMGGAVGDQALGKGYTVEMKFKCM